MGSNTTRGMDVCVYSMFVLDSGLVTGWSAVQDVLPTEINTPKWNDAFHGCPMFQLGATEIEEEEEEEEGEEHFYLLT
jgi:hypothetical protein